jgi:hypothetical protein
MKTLLFLAFICSAAWSAGASFDWDPFYEGQTNAAGVSFQAWRPFYSKTTSAERWRKDYLWPLYTRKGFKKEAYGRFLFMGWSADFSPETERHRTWILPFYFRGTSAQGEDYFAIFPLGGTLCEFLTRDRIHFVLFPLYVRSSINEVETTSVLWPIGSKTSGDRVERFRVWPFYGTSVLEDEFEKKFVLWPLYSSVKYTNDRNPGGGFMLLPLYGRVVTEKAKNQWFLPPFFRFAQGGENRIINAPWPFIQLRDGDVQQRYVWPLYGQKQTDSFSRQFWLWPLVWDGWTKHAGYDAHRFRLLPFFHYETEMATTPTVQHAEGDAVARYWKLWPLLSWERKAEVSRLRLLEVWPLRNTPGVERNWAPLWTLYRREKNPDTVSHHVLWGLYRQTKGAADVEWSLLKGLAEYKKIENRRAFRLFFFRFGNEEILP